MFQPLSPGVTLNLEKGYQKDSSLWDNWLHREPLGEIQEMVISYQSPLWHVASQAICLHFLWKTSSDLSGTACSRWLLSMSSCWSRSHAFPVVVPAPESSLPPEIQMAPTLLTLIKEIKTWLFPQAFGLLNELCYELADWFYCSGKFGVIFLDPGLWLCGLLAL